MPHHRDPACVRSAFQAAQRKRSCRCEIAKPVLVMDRERFGRFARDVRWTVPDIEQLAPPRRRRIVLSRATERDRQGAEGGDSDRCRWPSRRFQRLGHTHRALKRGQRVPAPAHALVHLAEGVRFARVACAIGPAADQMQQPRGQPGQGHEIEAIVLEDRRKRTRIAGPDELEVAGRNLEP